MAELGSANVEEATAYANEDLDLGLTNLMDLLDDLVEVEAWLLHEGYEDDAERVFDQAQAVRDALNTLVYAFVSADQLMALAFGE